MIPFLIDKNFDLVKLFESGDLPVFDSDNNQIYVFDPNPSTPESNGIGILAETSECVAKHVINGEDEIVLKYPVDGELYDKIELREIIVSQVDRIRGNQPYRIYRITKPIKGHITIYARHIAYDLSGIVVRPYSAITLSEALAGLKNNAMVSCPFNFSTTRDVMSNFEVSVPVSIWSLLGGGEGSLLDVYGGEYCFNGFNISLENKIGEDRGVSVRYGVNMTDFQQDANCADCYTGVVAYYADTEQIVYSDVISAFGDYQYVKIMTIDLTPYFNSAPTRQALNEAARVFVEANQIGVPNVSWTVNFIPLDTTEEYKDISSLESVSLGDTVKVIFEKLNVNATARVVGIEWNVLTDKYISVELGSIKSTLASTISNQTRTISSMPSTEEVKNISATVASGIVADWIETHKINADLIEGGTLVLGRELNEAGKIDIYDENNNFIGSMYNGGIWYGNSEFSALQNQNGFNIRRKNGDNFAQLVYIGRGLADQQGNVSGIIQTATVDSNLQRTVNAFINGDGTISCKRLFVNGHEIT